MQEQRIYRPQWYQKEFHKSKARYRMLMAGRQSGKTLSGIMEALRQAQEKPGSTGLIIAPTYNMLWDNIIKDMLSWINPTAIKEWNQTRLDLKIKNGTEIRFRSGDNPDRFRGTRPDWIWADELRDMKPDVWDVIEPGMAVTNGIAWFSTTPNGRDWTYKRFVVPALEGNKHFWWKQVKTLDNKYANIERIELARQTSPEWWFRQEYEASIEDFVGLIYPEFKQSIHVIANIDIQPSWIWLEGVDVGYTNPSCVLLACEDEDKNLYIVDEIYQSRLLPDELASQIKALEARYNLSKEAIYSRTIDPASAQKPQAAGGDSVQAQLAENGVFTSSAMKHEVKDGIVRVAKYFKVDEKTKKPKLFIHSRCKHLIQEIEEYVWDDTNKDDRNSKEQPRKFKDHAMDALRYLIMSRPDFAEYPKIDPWTGKTYFDGTDPDEAYLEGLGVDNNESDAWEDVL